MSVDTMCPGGDCEIKQWCYRYTAEPTVNQKYFSKPPMHTWWGEGLLWGKVYSCPHSWTLSVHAEALTAWSNKIKKTERRMLLELKKSKKVVGAGYFIDRATKAHFCSNEGHCRMEKEP